MTFHIFTVITASILVQTTETFDVALSKTYDKSQRVMRGASRTLTFFITLFLFFVIFPAPYVIIILYFSGGFDEENKDVNDFKEVYDEHMNQLESNYKEEFDTYMREVDEAGERFRRAVEKKDERL